MSARDLTTDSPPVQPWQTHVSLGGIFHYTSPPQDLHSFERMSTKDLIICLLQKSSSSTIFFPALEVPKRIICHSFVINFAKFSCEFVWEIIYRSFARNLVELSIEFLSGYFFTYLRWNSSDKFHSYFSLRDVLATSVIGSLSSIILPPSGF